MIKKLIIFLIVAVPAVFYGISYSETNTLDIDNAYVSARIIEIKAPMNGVIESIHIKPGSKLNQGNVLFAYDEVSAQLRLKKTKQKFQLAIQDEFEKCLTQQTSKSKLELSNLQQQHHGIRVQRGYQLNKDKLLSQDAFDDMLFQYDTAKLQTEIADKELTEIKFDNIHPILSRPRVQLARNEFETALHDQRLIEVKAPYTGFIYDVMVYSGQHVAAGDILAVLIAYDNVRIEANVLEAKVAKLKPGMAVDIYPDVYPENEKITGYIESIVPSTASSFSPLPRNNVDSNWIRVSQRVPVLVAFDYQALDKNKPLPIGSSVKLKLDLSGQIKQLKEKPVLLTSQLSQPRWQPKAEEYLQQVVAQATELIKQQNQHGCQL